MKKIYLALLIVIFSSNLFGQQDNTLVLDSTLSYTWRSGDWKFFARTDRVYNNSGKVIELISDWYSPIDNNEELTRSIYKYDSTGNIIEEISYQLDFETSAWIPSWEGRIEYIYNEEGNKIEEINYRWDSEANEWVGSILIWNPNWVGGRKVFTYDADGRIVEEVIYSWDAESNSWSLFKEYDAYNFMGVGRRFIYQYDEKDNLVEEISYRWDPDSSEWVLQYPWSVRTVYTYNAPGNLTEKISYHWHSETNVWAEKFIQDYTYDAKGNLTEEISYLRNSETNELVKLDMHSYSYSYDANGNRKEKIAYSWNPDIEDWEYQAKVEFYWSGLDSDTVAIPDTAFLYALLEEGVDTNGDSLISYGEAEAIISLNVAERITGQVINDLTGIEAFTNLEKLDVQNNNLWSIDISRNLKLRELVCGNNQLNSLDLKSNSALEELWCFNNQLNELDLSGNAALVILECSRNQLITLDLSNNPGLRFLNCSYNKLQSIDVTKNKALEFLQVGSIRYYPVLEETNQLTSLDVSNNTILRELNCSHNQITHLDLSNNLVLKYFFCADNQLTSLDVSNNTRLEEFSCSNNLISQLDLSYNTAIREISLNDLPLLGKVCVWELPFPFTGDGLNIAGSPNIFFTDCIDPEIIAVDNLYQPEFIETTSSEDGVIYLVPEDTEKDIIAICRECIDSVMVVANSSVNISLDGLENGLYQLYARDATGNLSEPVSFSIMGVGIASSQSDQIRLFPNPFNNLLTIRTTGIGTFWFNVTSINGQLIYSDKIAGPSYQLDFSSFQKGVYLITIRSKDFVRTEKVIKQ